MNKIEFKLEPYEVRGYRDVYVHVYVDGRSLRDMQFEREQGLLKADGHSVAGAEPLGWLWGGLGVTPLSEYFLGEKAGHFESGPRHKTVVLTCPSDGRPECCCFMTEITVTPESVTWSNSEDPRRPDWDFSDLHFEFDRAQYGDALRIVEDELSSLKLK